MPQPNIVFLFSDQQRWDTCGCYGQPLPVTPNLDRMAAEGVRFEHAFTCQPVCGPARAALELYQSVFGGDLTAVTYADAHAVTDPAEEDQIMWAQLVSPHPRSR